jgi:cyclic lactone autoinducer peptide
MMHTTNRLESLKETVIKGISDRISESSTNMWQCMILSLYEPELPEELINDAFPN